MVARYLAALWLALGCLAATAAEPSTQSSSQPDGAVGAPSASTASTEVNPAPEDAAPAPAKNASTSEARSAKSKPNDDFTPSEAISEDMAVAYPVDI